MSEPARPIIGLSEAAAFLRLETGDEEALLAGFIRTASALCEAFINQVVIARPFELILPANGQWQRLALTPVRSIDSIEALAADGSAVPVTAGAVESDVDAAGEGWVRANVAAARKIKVNGRAGVAEDQNSVPEPLRQGVLRLVAHLFTARDGDEGEPPAAVTALWRPYRRMKLA